MSRPRAAAGGDEDFVIRSGGHQLIENGYQRRASPIDDALPADFDDDQIGHQPINRPGVGAGEQAFVHHRFTHERRIDL